MIKAKENILANGVSYKPGDIISGLSLAQERQLVHSKSAEMVNEQEQETAPVVAPKTPEKPKVSEVPDKNWTKVKLLGHARKLGLVVEDTMTKAEILKVIESNPQATEPNEDEGAELKTPAVTRLPENAPAVVPQAKGPGADDVKE